MKIETSTSRCSVGECKWIRNALNQHFAHTRGSICEGYSQHNATCTTIVVRQYPRTNGFNSKILSKILFRFQGTSIVTYCLENKNSKLSHCDKCFLICNIHIRNYYSCHIQYTERGRVAFNVTANLARATLWPRQTDRQSQMSCVSHESIKITNGNLSQIERQ